MISNAALEYWCCANEFGQHHPEFIQEQPSWNNHDGPLTENVTYWPAGWLRRK